MSGKSEMSDASGHSEAESAVAFLMSWDGAAWRDVVRLKQNQIITIGRSTTNRIVLHDEACSRNHCEVFFADDEWVLRDLGSRNGTIVNQESVKGDRKLIPGDTIRIGGCRLAYTNDLEAVPPPALDSDSIMERETSLASSEEEERKPSILHRTKKPTFLDPENVSGANQQAGPELTRLYELGLKMGMAESRQALTEVLLESLARETVADISAILLVRADLDGQPAPADLQVVAYDSRKDLPYRRVSDNLSRVVLSSREAILATDVSDDRQLAVFDSLGEMRALSVICAPIHCDDYVRGLIHLYSTNPDNPLDGQDLDFTTALAQQLALALDHLQERDSLKSGLDQVRLENKSLRSQLQEEKSLIGESNVMEDLRQRIDLIAETDANVLIRGESGCGKELIARTIHLSSPRRDQPFVCLNCAALNESLLESELFGHEKGAFTGATERKEGRFEQANNGTLFLDEVGEMSPSIQAKFLRILEGHPFERVGGQKQIQVDVRIIAATNRNLEDAVEDGSFRKDLYFRLHVAELIATPLRDRRDDIPLLADAFLKRFAAKTGRMISGFSDEALQQLVDYDWPGNVRELQNTIERTVILCRNEIVTGDDVQLSSLSGRLSEEAPQRKRSESYEEMSLADIERDHILSTLDHTDWNKSKAAQILGIERSTLDRKLKRYDVSRPD